MIRHLGTPRSTLRVLSSNVLDAEFRQPTHRFTTSSFVMGSVNSIPVISQFKSFLQAISGQIEAAKRTQLDFIHECPVVSQITSFIQACQGNLAAATATQMRFLANLSHVADALPVVGFLKGLVHAILGDMDSMIASFKAQGRTAGCIVGGLAGMFSGPLGAYAGGVLGGLSVDALYSLIEGELHGIFASLPSLLFLNKKNNDFAGAVVDFVFGLAADALAGCNAAGFANGIRIRNLGNRHHGHPSQYSHGKFVSPFTPMDHNVGLAHEAGEHVHAPHSHHDHSDTESEADVASDYDDYEPIFPVRVEKTKAFSVAAGGNNAVKRRPRHAHAD